MSMPAGFDYKGSKHSHVLKLKRNLYGQKQAGRVWYLHLCRLLQTRHNFAKSEADECVFYRDRIMLLVFVDDTICVFKDKRDQELLVNELKTSFDITVEGTISDFLGVKFERRSDGSWWLTQPHLINSILRELGLLDDKDNKFGKPKRTPHKVNTILRADKQAFPHNGQWEYRRVVGMLNFLEKSTRPDIGYAVHQCARFSSSPRTTHTVAIMRIGLYLLGTRHHGIIFRPTKHSLDCWVDADFAGNWSKDADQVDPDNVRSRSGYVIDYGGVPLVRHSKLQG
jgi:hypothetical protein